MSLASAPTTAISAAVISANQGNAPNALITAIVSASVGLLAGLAALLASPKVFYEAVFAYEDARNDGQEVAREYVALLKSSGKEHRLLSDLADLAQEWAQGNAVGGSTTTYDDVRRRIGTVFEAWAFNDDWLDIFEIPTEARATIAVYVETQPPGMLRPIFWKRTFDTVHDEPRSWPASDKDGGHVGLAFSRARSVASVNIWKTSEYVVSGSLAREDDRQNYVSVVASPIFKRGREGAAHAEARGVVVVTTDSEGHFGPENGGDNDRDKQRWGDRNLRARLLSAILAPALRSVTVPKKP